MATTNPAAMAGQIAGASAAGGIDYDKLAAAMGNQPLQIVIDGRVISEITKKQSMNKSFNKQMG
jgi:3-keto-L-gulonate-6-phosphate decarboxylase